MQEAISIIDELEDAIRNGSSAKRTDTLRKVTDLFLEDGQRLSEEQVQVFDHVLSHLVARVESRVKIELGNRLAPVDFAPAGVVERLAWDDEIAVAGTVLTGSSRLTTSTLVEIAKAKGQDHLLAISGRSNLSEDVTDVLVERGERKVIRRLANNGTAHFSEAGYSGMVAHAEADEKVAEMLGLRVDLPLKYLRELLQRATEAVRARLTSIAPPELQAEISRILTTLVKQTSPNPAARDFTQAEAVVKRMKGLNELNDLAIGSFAESKQLGEVAAALGLLNNSAPTELMARVRADLVLIPCKSAGLSWTTVEKILRHRKQRIDDATLKVAYSDFNKLSVPTAERTLRFWQLHNKVEKPVMQ